MTPTQKGRRSDALYMDTRATHRRQLCDMVVNREADIEDLKEEMYGLRCDIGRLENENAKLRKIVKEMSDTKKLQKVYLVEVSDELLESWFPSAVFLHRESAEDYAEALRGKDDGVLCFARVSELKVMDS